MTTFPAGGSMNYEVFITSAVTGSGDTAGKSDKVPVTPKEIADAAIEAAKAGAAIAHIHVRVGIFISSEFNYNRHLIIQ